MFFFLNLEIIPRMQGQSACDAYTCKPTDLEELPSLTLGRCAAKSPFDCEIQRTCGRFASSSGTPGEKCDCKIECPYGSGHNSGSTGNKDLVERVGRAEGGGRRTEGKGKG